MWQNAESTRKSSYGFIMSYEETGRRGARQAERDFLFSPQKMEEVDPGKLQAGEPDGSSGKIPINFCTDDFQLLPKTLKLFHYEHTYQTNWTFCNKTNRVSRDNLLDFCKIFPSFL